uniref:Uncharacterized protein n=1 Tax=Oryza punctata TaxID=4537 RepID=A0A0E0JI28_ORYPU
MDNSLTQILFRGPFADITNVINANSTNKCAAVIQSEINVPNDYENCQQNNKDSTSKIQISSTIGFGNKNYASIITAMRLPSRDNAELSSNMHEDVTNLNAAELKRKRAIEWYASLTKEQKEDRNKKRRDSRKRKKDESIAPLGDITNVRADDPGQLGHWDVNDGFLETPTTTGVGSAPKQHIITPKHLQFTVINNEAHYDFNGDIAVPLSCIIQGST